MQQHGKYYITLKGVHYEVSQNNFSFLLEN